MHRRFILKTAGLCLCTVLGLSVTSADARDKPAPKEPACGDHGTSVNFFDSPQEAAKRAVKDQKLVFVLHVSGNFEDPGLT